MKEVFKQFLSILLHANINLSRMQDFIVATNLTHCSHCSLQVSGMASECKSEGLGLDFSCDTEMVYSILPYILPFYEKLCSQS